MSLRSCVLSIFEWPFYSGFTQVLLYFQQEAKALPGVGKRLAEKIWEIAESGELRKLNEFKSSDEIRVIEMFKDVWGAGATTARTWYQQVNTNWEPNIWKVLDLKN